MSLSSRIIVAPQSLHDNDSLWRLRSEKFLGILTVSQEVITVQDCPLPSHDIWSHENNDELINHFKFYASKINELPVQVISPVLGPSIASIVDLTRNNRSRGVDAPAAVDPLRKAASCHRTLRH